MESDNESTPEFNEYFHEYAPDIELDELRAAAAPKDCDLDEELEEINNKAERYLEDLRNENGFDPIQKKMKDITLYLGNEGMIYSPHIEDLNSAAKFYYFLFSDEKESETVDKSAVNYWSPKENL